MLTNLPNLSTTAADCCFTIKKVKNKTEMSEVVGKAIAEKAKGKKIESVVLDRNGSPYHGRVKAFAEAARKNGLEL